MSYRAKLDTVAEIMAMFEDYKNAIFNDEEQKTLDEIENRLRKIFDVN